MSNRRRRRVRGSDQEYLKVGLILDPDDPVETTVMMVFRRATFGDVAAANRVGAQLGADAWTSDLASRTYLRTVTPAEEDLVLSWDELSQGLLTAEDLLGRVHGREARSNLQRTLAAVESFNAIRWDSGAGG